MEAMSDKLFPIMQPSRKEFRDIAKKLSLPRQVPWGLLEPHKDQAKINHDQTLNRLAQRGGLDPMEALAILNDNRWREQWPDFKIGDGCTTKEYELAVTELVRMNNEFIAANKTEKKPESEPSNDHRIGELEGQLAELKNEHEKLVAALQLLVQSPPLDPSELPTALGEALMKVGLVS